MVYLDIDYTLFNTSRFRESGFRIYNLYEEVIETLKRLRDIANLGIFSNGENEFQKDKLEKTGISVFFDKNNIHIYDDKDVNLVNVLSRHEGQKLFMVDDKLMILRSAKKSMPQITTVWVKRGPYAAAQESIPGFTPDAQVDNLSDIVKIVKLEIKN